MLLKNIIRVSQTPLENVTDWLSQCGVLRFFSRDTCYLVFSVWGLVFKWESCSKML